MFQQPQLFLLGESGDSPVGLLSAWDVKQLWTRSIYSRSKLLVLCSGQLTWGCIPGVCLPSSGSYSCIWESAGDKDTEAENKLFSVLTLSCLNLKLLSLFCTWFKTWGDEKIYGHWSRAMKPLSLLYWDPSTAPISFTTFKIHVNICIYVIWPLKIYPGSKLVNLTYLIPTCRIKSIDNSSSTYPPRNNRRIKGRISVLSGRASDYRYKPRNGNHRISAYLEYEKYYNLCLFSLILSLCISKMHQASLYPFQLGSWRQQ